jgi:hypothetical protein
MFTTTNNLLESEITFSSNSNNSIYIPKSFEMEINVLTISYSLLIFSLSVALVAGSSSPEYQAKPSPANLVIVPLIYTILIRLLPESAM